MAGIVALTRSWGPQKPPPGTPLNGSHPLAFGLDFFCPLNEPGGPPRDRVSNTTGALTSMAWASGSRGPALAITANGGSADFSQNNLQYTSQDFSFSWLLRPDTLNNVTVGGNGANGANGYYFEISTNVDGDGDFSITTSQSAANQQTRSSLGAITAKAWNHVVVTRKGSRVRFYVNGSETGYAAVGTHADPAPTANPFSLGNYSAKTHGFFGLIDHCFAWNRRALTAGEANALYRDTNGLLLPPAPRRFFSVPAAGSFSPSPSGGLTAGGSAVVTVTFSPTHSGGLVAGGSVTPGVTFSPAHSGGLVSGGSVTPGVVFSPAPSGSLLASGAAPPAVTFAPPHSGGLVLSGAGTPVAAFSPSPSGAVALSGAATAQLSGQFVVTPSGGLVASGTATTSAAFAPPPSGGLVTSGSGTSAAAFAASPSGGPVAGGTVTPAAAFSPAPSGGAVVGGAVAPTVAFSPAAAGGVTLAGSADASGNNTFNRTGSGGVVAGGSVAPSTAFSPAATGTLTAGGSATGSPSFTASPSGGVVLSGLASFSGPSASFTATASGGLTVAGSSAAVFAGAGPSDPFANGPWLTDEMSDPSDPFSNGPWLTDEVA